jgi:DNA modification methylase
MLSRLPLSSLQRARWSLHTADVLAAFANLADNSQDAALSDPPYGLGKEPDALAMLKAWVNGEVYHPGGGGFMGKTWDAIVPGPEVWRELYRVLKPGASAIVFAGDRTEDLMCMSLRLAGFIKRGTIPYLYGTGFPKNMNIGQAVDAHLGTDRPVVGRKGHSAKFAGAGNGGFNDRVGIDGKPATFDLTAAGSQDAEAWESHGTALKPCYEPAIWVQKPNDGTFANNALTWGVAGINVDGARLGVVDADYVRNCAGDRGHADNRNRVMEFHMGAGRAAEGGRWPGNVIVDEAIAALLGPAAPFFYTAKPDRTERDAGLEGFAVRTGGELTDREDGTAGLKNPRAGAGRSGGGRNTHPCVKPVSLTQHLATLLLPPGRPTEPRRIVVPFCGSGSEMIGALLAGWEDITGIDLDPEYIAIAEARLTHWANLDRPKSKPTGQISLFDMARLAQEGA